MVYRETYGYEIRNDKWRAQFVGKNANSKLKLDDDIKNISGATLSCRHITDGVKRCSHFMKSHCVELRRARPLLGTIVDIQVRAPNDFTAMRAIEDAFDAVERVHRLMSFHDPASDVSRLNREAHQHAIKVDDWTWRVLQAAHKFADESNGAFDITIGRLLTSWNLPPAP